MKDELVAISLMMFATLYLSDPYGLLASMAISAILVVVMVYSPVIKLGNMYWSLSRSFTMLSNGGNNAFMQRVTLEEEGFTILWAMLGPIAYVPTLFILKHAGSGLDTALITRVMFVAAIMSLLVIREVSANPRGVAVKFSRVSILFSATALFLINVAGHALSDAVSITLLSSYLATLLVTDVRNIPYLASNGSTNIILGGYGTRDALVIVPISSASLVWIILQAIST